MTISGSLTALPLRAGEIIHRAVASATEPTLRERAIEALQDRELMAEMAGLLRPKAERRPTHGKHKAR